MDETEAKLDLCESLIGYRFRDRSLVRAALTHASGANHRLQSNERMEFLGDAILGYVVCDLLFQQYPSFLEGDLTRIKSMVVSRETCAEISKSLELADCLILGKGMQTSDVVPDSLMADLFESLVAAVYLDAGIERTAEFIREHIESEVEAAVSGESGKNYKSLLQQYAQRMHGATPTYQIVEEEGPDHNKRFRVAAKVASKLYTSAWGKNKKEAEKRAARNALSEIDADDSPD